MLTNQSQVVPGNLRAIFGRCSVFEAQGIDVDQRIGRLTCSIKPSSREIQPAQSVFHGLMALFAWSATC